MVGHRPYKITARGIARTFQNIRLFPSLSVFDNVRTACNMHLRHGISHALARGLKFAAEEREIDAKVMELLEIFGLTAERDAPALAQSLSALARDPACYAAMSAAASARVAAEFSLSTQARVLEAIYREVAAAT